jgi:hypothetical protein
MVDAHDNLRACHLEVRNQVGGEGKFEELDCRRLGLRAGIFARWIGLTTLPVPAIKQRARKPGERQRGERGGLAGVQINDSKGVEAQPAPGRTRMIMSTRRISVP